MEYAEKGNNEENNEMHFLSNEDKKENIFEFRESGFTRNEDKDYSDKEINFNNLAKEKDNEIIKEYTDNNFWGKTAKSPENLDFLNDLL